MKKTQGFIRLFARHRVAANLLMIFLVMMGGWSLRKLNTQFFPTIDLNFIVVVYVWPGSAADDVEKSITTPLEKELRDLDNVKEMRSRSQDGASTIIIEFQMGTDMGYALDQVNEKVAQVSNLPQDVEKPIITRVILYEPVAKLLLVGGKDLNDLRQRTYFYERQLLDRGISKVSITGLPEREIAIQIPAAKLAEIRMSLDQVATILRQRSKDVPSGSIGKLDIERQLRTIGQQRSAEGFLELPLITDRTGQLIRLGDIAKVERRNKVGFPYITYNGKPAVQIEALRSTDASSIRSARILDQWVKEVRPSLPEGMQLIVYDERWTFILQRITLLMENGLQGFILIIIILFILLNRRVAFWVAMGIPISLFTAMIVLYLSGGSINMISMFAFIMTLGIIVDDTIVVGEETLTQLQNGKAPLEAVEIGANKMLPPIAASSLTTIAAFFPLMFIGGVMGNILLQIPLVVICVLSASLIETFLILPGHLHHSLKREMINDQGKHRIRHAIDSGFDRLKDNYYRRFVHFAVANYGATLASAFAIFLLSLGLVMGGRVSFTFFPQPEGKIIRANAEFSQGTPTEVVDHFMTSLEKGLNKVNNELSEPGEPIVKNYIVVRNVSAAERLESELKFGEPYAHIFVELTEPDDRKANNAQIIRMWRESVAIPPELELFAITEPRVGPPGEDLDIRISGQDWDQLKTVATKLKEEMKIYNGVYDIKDDLPFGKEQFIYDISVEGKALGLTTDSIGRQLRAAFNGEIVQIFHEPNEEIEVRVMLPDEERYRLHTLESLPIMTPNKEAIPLRNAIDVRSQKSLNVLRHSNTLPTVHVTATIDSQLNNANTIISDLSSYQVEKLQQNHDVLIDFVGRAEEQNEAIEDMKLGGWVALALIYIILAWVFSSYTLPILIMLAIPLGITGAIFGHYLLGIDLTILSLFGIFGLSGIVINDSIILVSSYLQIRDQYDNIVDAIAAASCQRLRAVILTSLTTIAGLTPLLFETSLQAKFLIPMAVAIIFGLMYATILVLVLVPCLLYAHQRLRDRFRGRRDIAK